MKGTITRELGSEIGFLALGSRTLGPGTKSWDLGLGPQTLDLGPGIWNWELGPEAESWDQGRHRSLDPGTRTWDLGPRLELGQKTWKLVTKIRDFRSGLETGNGTRDPDLEVDD